MNNQFLTKSEFAKLVENTVLKQKNSYMDVILDLCESHGIDPEDIKKFLSPPIIEKIENEAMQLNLIQRGNQLLFE
jgi:UDP-glucose 6-dehydrogenase